ncbi:MAG TPA: hypothetical protein VGL58_08420 [Caulobacteraceae bacterium]|jgi:tetratricopeptide (TPR) repeat protein
MLKLPRLAAAVALTLLSACGQGAPPPAQPAFDADQALNTCSDFGSDDATRLTACNAVIQSSAPADTRKKALNNRGVMTMQKGDNAAAITDFNAAIALDGAYAAAFYNRSHAEKAAGDAAAADADMAQAVKLQPDLAGH